MNECYAAWYAWDGSDWQERRAPCLVSPEDARLAEPGWLLAGNVFDAYGARLPAQAGRRAGHVAEVADQAQKVPSRLDDVGDVRLLRRGQPRVAGERHPGHANLE